MGAFIFFAELQSFTLIMSEELTSDLHLALGDVDPMLGISPIDVIVNNKNSFNMDWERDHCGRKHNFIWNRKDGNTDPVPTRTQEPQNDVCPRSYTEIGIDKKVLLRQRKRHTACSAQPSLAHVDRQTPMKTCPPRRTSYTGGKNSEWDSQHIDMTSALRYEKQLHVRSG